MGKEMDFWDINWAKEKKKKKEKNSTFQTLKKNLTAKNSTRFKSPNQILSPREEI